MYGVHFLKRIVLLLLLAAIFTAFRAPRPKIFLMGDSISIYYGPYLIKDLSNVADIDQKKIDTLQGKRFSRNGGDSRRVLDYLTAKLQQPGFHPDYLILNCGLHDVGRDTLTNKIQVPADQYKKNLESIFSLIRKNKIRIIWITTTPVVDSIHNSRTRVLHRYSADLENYNQIAKKVCDQFHVPMVDLHDFTVTLGPSAYLDNVHYKEEFRPLQAAYIAGAVRMIINNPETQEH